MSTRVCGIGASQAEITVGDRLIGPGRPCFVVAEIAQAHDGSLGAAHAYVDAVSAAGADAVKFQTHIAPAESTARETFRVAFSRQDATRYAYWKRVSFTEPQWAGLAAHARERGLIFLSSPFSIEAADLLERIGMPAWKVGSGEITNLPLIDRLAATGKPVLLSSGLTGWPELDAAVSQVRRAGAGVAVFQCTSKYPCAPEDVGLNNLALLADRYSCPVGLSDHSGTIYPGLAAAALGAALLEVHVTLSREAFGPDVPASVTTHELRQLADGLRFLSRALSHPTDKDRLADELAGMRQLFFKSVVAARELPAGQVLGPTDLALKKPGTGLPPSSLASLLGRRLRRTVAADQLLAEDDVE